MVGVWHGGCGQRTPPLQMRETYAFFCVRRARECRGERERGCVCVCERERERDECVCMCERERER